MRHAALLLLTSVFLFGGPVSQAFAAETVCENTETEQTDSPGSLLRFRLFLWTESLDVFFMKKTGRHPDQMPVPQK